MSRKSGIYGLFRLDGAPIDPADAAVLGIGIPGEPGAGHAEGVDSGTPPAVHRDDADGLTILVGDIEEPAELAERLKLPATARPATLARVALKQFGAEMPAMVIGEWTLLHWDRGRLTLMTSAARRDWLLFAISGPRVAVAPDLFGLSRLPWVGTALDDAGILLGLGRMSLRLTLRDQTMLERVKQIGPGSCVEIGPDGVRERSAVTLTPQPLWHGSFEDALAEAEALMRRIMRSRLARTVVPMGMLSGGLDSSLLAWLAANERAPGQPVRFVTSVAPDGSGLDDEGRFADIVAHRLGLRSEHVFPAEEANIYRPSERIFRGAIHPPLANRHYLTESFHIAAAAAGATQLIDGGFGELTVTGYPPLTMPQRLRGTISRLRHSIRSPAEAAPIQPFHVRLSAHRLAILPEDVRAGLGASPEPVPEQRWSDQLGYLIGATKVLQQANAFFPGAVRTELPFRDLRLLRLFAGFPVRFLGHGGRNRAFVRHMLAGRLPDSIRLRPMGMPASPDHLPRLQRHAPSARARIPAFRKAEVDEWLDLDWLDGALARIAERGTTSHLVANEVQLTAIVAEFLTWWRTRA